MRSPLGFGGVILHYNQFRLLRLSSKRLGLPNPFINFSISLLEEEVKPT